MNIFSRFDHTDPELLKEDSNDEIIGIEFERLLSAVDGDWLANPGKVPFSRTACSHNDSFKDGIGEQSRRCPAIFSFLLPVHLRYHTYGVRHSSVDDGLYASVEFPPPRLFTGLLAGVSCPSPYHSPPTQPSRDKKTKTSGKANKQGPVTVSPWCEEASQRKVKLYSDRNSLLHPLLNQKQSLTSTGTVSIVYARTDLASPLAMAVPSVFALMPVGDLTHSMRVSMGGWFILLLSTCILLAVLQMRRRAGRWEREWEKERVL